MRDFPLLERDGGDGGGGGGGGGCMSDFPLLEGIDVKILGVALVKKYTFIFLTCKLWWNMQL